MEFLIYLSNAVQDGTHFYLPDHVDAEIQSFEAGHGQEGRRKDFSNQVAAQIEVLQGLEVLQITLSNGLSTILHKVSKLC